ncbi:MAG TPA: hypothetical protein ENK43_01345 [Planctomycetes bacterium]|nr:hypothetical protein [Planctomycetota bacterium]
MARRLSKLLSWGRGVRVLAFVLAILAGSVRAQDPVEDGGSNAAAPFLHAVVLHDEPAEFRGKLLPPWPRRGQGIRLRASKGRPSTYVSQQIEAPFPFDRLLPSWNVDLPRRKNVGFSVALRVRKKGGTWSPWLDFGGWGKRPVDKAAVTRWEDGRVAIDDLVGSALFTHAQYRVTARGRGEFVLRRFALCFSARNSGDTSRARAPGDAPPRRLWVRRLPVPFISQKTDDPRIAHRNCSPTSLSMVMAYRGVRRDKDDVARRIFDPEHDIFGNWNRAIEGAFTYGVPGYLARFSNWNEVKTLIAKGQPLVISIKAKKGELTGAPYTWTAGHLLVLCGFDGKGGVLMNDPAAGRARRGQLTYSMQELSRVWLEKGGTAYVLLPRP